MKNQKSVSGMTRHASNFARAFTTVGFGVLLAGVTGPAGAGVMFNEVPANTIGGGSRWDAAPRNVAGVGERSLDGGLRYALQGGSFQAYRDLFTWNVLPSVADFQAAVQQAFIAWTVTDPVSLFTTQINFMYDPNTAVVGTAAGGGVNVQGAEIDLLGSTSANSWGVGSTGTQGETFFNTVAATVTLTSGTANYAGSGAISGADLTINSNPGAVYTLDFFRRLLTHEIGHALGLGDIEPAINPGAFIDDNYQAGNPATLANNWANLVNSLNPGASLGLQRFGILQADVNAVDILMESNGLGINPGNPVMNLLPLANDDYSMRQFMYPSLTQLPEPGTLVLFAIGLLLGFSTIPRREPCRAG